MQRSLQYNSKPTTRRTSPDQSQRLRILNELGGRSCKLCGCRQYRLVVRVKARGADVSLLAKCRQCESPITGYSLDQLCEDVNRFVNNNMDQ